MWNKIKILFTLLLLSYSLGLNAQDSAPSDVNLRWEAIPGALGYIVEARTKSGKVFLSEKTSVSNYELANVEPGIYEHRVGVINKFGKVEGYTDWKPFEVVQTRLPILNDRKVYSAGKDETLKRLEISGNDFMDNMKVYLKKDGKVITPVKVEISKDGKTAKADFKIEDFPETGAYDLILENPKKKIAVNQRNFILGRDKEQAEKIAQRQARINNNEIPPDYYDTPYWSTMWRSTILPGWGQEYIDDKSWKLYTYPIVLLAAVGVYAKSYQDFLGARKEYYEAVQFGFILTSTSSNDLLFLYNNQESVAKYEAARSRLDQIKIGAGAVGLFALYNIVDAFLSVRRNVAVNENKGFKVSEQMEIRANSVIRRASNFEPSTAETYNHLEIFMRF
ncbi:DUF5683 domain-containing protein [Leptospira sp. GIMC2001]|uniref:DUF5683 domain-containing protein n=1 Tax=Leptospira sp. GIMC2001 TaxID=1513297 RepID=UPI00234A855F|nr:DUF5683 domain-containing protein [Leptospira sp. GIMC2001]WCL48063.1 DUF5683 domain-containing protein [Leptospira sp. GIMC2001]